MRTRFAVSFIIVAGLTFACGGDDDEQPATSTPTVAVSSDDTVAPTGEPEPTATATSTPMPTPTPVPEGGPGPALFGGGQSLMPTVAEFRELPQASITLANGDLQMGTSIAELSTQLGLDEPFSVTIEGFSRDFQSIGFVRYPYADVASDTVLFVTDRGHAALVSLSIPESQWLDAVVTVAFE